ncbi:MAG: hypothetical protein ACI9SP_003637 [Arenicella sp.]
MSAAEGCLVGLLRPRCAKHEAIKQRVTFNKSIEVISEVFGHGSVNVTRAYIGILREEVHALYKNEI